MDNKYRFGFLFIMKKYILFIAGFFFITLNALAQDVIFTKSGSYTVPAGVTKIFAEALGAGGMGLSNGLSGGGGGGYASGIYDVTPGQAIKITIDTSDYSDKIKKTSVGNFIVATGGSNASFNRDNNGFGIVGTGGQGSGGNIANYKGGNGGKGYWTYYGGGGGGAAGRNGDGQNGGDTKEYVSSECSHPGGAPGLSGGFPGGNGSKGAGYLNCLHGSDNKSPATSAGLYGAGGGGGNGSGSPSTAGSSGWVRISTCLIQADVTQIGLTLHANEENVTYQWVDSNYAPISGQNKRSFQVMQPGKYAVKLSNESCTVTSDFVKFDMIDIVKNTYEYGAFVYTISDQFVHQNKLTNKAFIEVVGAGGNGLSNGLSGGGGGGYASGIYNLTNGQLLNIVVEKPEYSTGEFKTAVGDLLYATAGTVSSFSRDVNGFGIVGTGGQGYGGNIANYKGGDGGKGYWTYYGGGGGGAAGRNGDGQNGGDTKKYVSMECSHPGGSAGLSGGFPGGNGSKGAGYLNCLHGSDNKSPATPAGLYGAGGGGGNGSGSPSTTGSLGWARISYCTMDFDVIKAGDLLTVKQDGVTYQWVRIKNESSIEIIKEANGKSYIMKPGDTNIAVYLSDGTCSGISKTFSQGAITNIPEVHSITKTDVLVFPNPAKDKISINCTGNQTFRIFNNIGQLMITEEIFDNKDVNITALEGGIYFYQIGNTKGKLIVE